MRAWLLPLATEVSLVGSALDRGMGLPYRAVTRLGGESDLIADTAALRVHTFAATYTEASRKLTAPTAACCCWGWTRWPRSPWPAASPPPAPRWTARPVPPSSPTGAETVVTRFISEYTLTLRFHLI